MSQRALHFNDLFAHPANIFSFGFGTGLSRYAPGTVGSLLGIPAFLLLPYHNIPVYLLWVIALFAFGVWCCSATTRYLDTHDHGGIVWDELVGMLIALIAVPASLPYLLLGFLLFRLFDIWKPWPIGWVDKRVHGGFGIMLDDIIAGVMACIAMQFIVHLLVPWLLKVFS